jgi:hypothetical protein
VRTAAGRCAQDEIKRTDRRKRKLKERKEKRNKEKWGKFPTLIFLGE